MNERLKNNGKCKSIKNIKWLLLIFNIKKIGIPIYVTIAAITQEIDMKTWIRGILIYTQKKCAEIISPVLSITVKITKAYTFIKHILIKRLTS